MRRRQARIQRSELHVLRRPRRVGISVRVSQQPRAQRRRNVPRCRYQLYYRVSCGEAQRKKTEENHSLTPQPNSSDAYDASIPGCTCCEGLKVREGFPQCENDDRRRRLRMLEDEDKEEKIAVVVVAA